ncbi:hypothetical protein [Actinoplanes utahensis]|uniref:hypothetical protein n=1 Tax=Actinoplanes utahensis TaxID=1869 RepID=UPI001377D54A|nr:hypothetical protein [Actinoplanes utahensis]GIF34012.1 hypothetical protein Aut01nite_69980 [Actinoplanes utahensis]
MIMLVIVAMTLLGGTAWTVMNQSIARNRVLNHRLSLAGLLACLAIGTGMLGTVAVTLL